MNTYLIYGNDYGLIKREIDKLTNGVTDIVKYDLLTDKIDELLDDASCMSLFGDKKVLVGENALFLTTTSTSINHNLDYLTNYLNDDNHENIVILSVLTDKLDERKKIVKLLKEKSKVIYKELIDNKDLPSFIINEFNNEGYKIDYKTANYFVNYVGKNVDILLSEINKMIIFKDNDKNITINDIDEISSKAINDNVFDLSDAIMKKDFKRMYDCYNDLIILKEEPIKIIAMLGNQFNLVYQCKLLSSKGLSEKEIATSLSVHPYRVKLAIETDYMISELKDILIKLHNLDFEIKSGKVDKNVGFDNFLLHL
ncbi:MAG: DNA polymerase III subunit delta [Candidatus Aphodocola sp.]